MKPPLDGIRVVDATTRWGELAGKVLAELGAEVIKIEPPEGCESRRLGPFDGDESLYWTCVGAGKKSVVADDVVRFLADADVFIESGRLGGPVPGRTQALIHVSVTPFGTTGPLADAPAAEVTVEAAGGLVGLQGDPDRPPVPMGAMPQGRVPRRGAGRRRHRRGALRARTIGARSTPRRPRPRHASSGP